MFLLHRIYLLGNDRRQIYQYCYFTDYHVFVYIVPAVHQLFLRFAYILIFHRTSRFSFSVPSGDESWFDPSADQGGVSELSPFDMKALDEDMKKLYQKQLYYQQSCQLREVERVLRRVLRIWTPDATGGVLHTATTAAEALAVKTAAAVAAAKNNVGTVGGVDASLGDVNGGELEGHGLELTRLTRKPPASADDSEETEKDDRDLAAILAAPSPELQAIMADAPATSAAVSSSAISSEEQSGLGRVVYYGDYISIVYPVVDASFPKSADVKEQVAQSLLLALLIYIPLIYPSKLPF